ncbi:uncharacterized protein SCO1/SenC/PrrC [Burkholderiales bacterium JOSHI_001]|nr:uncharacterized protein SCO1/SenC/PrrC [Burkholderiales bacterium JOSHI_001]
MPPEALEPVALTVHTLPAAGVDAPQQRTRRGRFVMLLVLAACAAPVLASYFLFYVARPAGGGAAYASLVQPTVALPDVLATDPQGQPLRLPTLKGQWLLVALVDGPCNAACEKRLYLQRQLREMLGRDRDRLDKVVLLSQATVLKPELLAALQTAPAAQVLRVPGDALSAWLKPEAGHALVDHLYVVDPMGQWMMRAPAALDASRFKRDLDRLLRASAFWDTPGR